MRVTEPACPFCGGAPGLLRRVGVGRRSRAILLGAVVLSSGCYESHRRPVDGEVIADAGAPEEEPSVALYGGPSPPELV